MRRHHRSPAHRRHGVGLQDPDPPAFVDHRREPGGDSIHFLAAIENGGYFEADISNANTFRDELGSTPWAIRADGTVLPNSAPGIGVEVDERFLEAHPFVDGPAYAEIPVCVDEPSPAILPATSREQSP